MKFFKILLLSFLAFSAAKSYAMEEYGTYLCEHKYDKKLKHYYCISKIKKVIFSIGMDRYYFQSEFLYINKARELFNKKITEINNKVKYFNYEVVDKSYGNKFIPKKNEVFVHVHYFEPDFTSKTMKVYAIIAINGKIEFSNAEFPLAEKNTFLDDFNKILDRSSSGLLSYLYYDERN